MRTPYFSYPLVDWSLAGGWSLVALAFFCLVPGELLAPRAVQFLVLYLVWAGNAPHFAATNYRLYRSKKTIARFPMTALVVPVVVAAGACAALAYPVRLAPYFIKLYLFWSPYHYSGQAVGLTLLYARRSGLTVPEKSRRWLATFVFGAFVAALAHLESQPTAPSFFGIAYPTLGLPSEVAIGALAGSLTAAAIWVLSLRKANLGKPIPPIVWLPGVAHAAWFLLGAKQPTFFALVPFFHGAQYLLVAGSLQLQERGRVSTWPIWRTLAELTMWSVAIVAGGVLLLGVLPRSIAQIDGRDPLFVMPIVIAAVQIHHFFVDGVLWKLRSPALAALLTGTTAQVTSSRKAAA